MGQIPASIVSEQVIVATLVSPIIKEPLVDTLMNEVDDTDTEIITAISQPNIIIPAIPEKSAEKENRKIERLHQKKLNSIDLAGSSAIISSTLLNRSDVEKEQGHTNQEASRFHLEEQRIQAGIEKNSDSQSIARMNFSFEILGIKCEASEGEHPLEKLRRLANSQNMIAVEFVTKKLDELKSCREREDITKSSDSHNEDNTSKNNRKKPVDPLNGFGLFSQQGKQDSHSSINTQIIDPSPH